MGDAQTCEGLLEVSSDLAAPLQLQAAGGEVCVFTTRAPDKPSVNEDGAGVFVCDGLRCVLAVADGMGGHPSGAQAASIALEELRAAVAQAVSEQTELRDAILNGFERANAAVRTDAPGSGTTLAVVEIDANTMRCYHAGDSAILAVGQRGQRRWETVAHSPVGYAVESGLLDAGDAMHHDDRHIVSNMVGSEEMRIEIGPPVKLKVRDTLLLATDGLTDNLSTPEIVEHIRKGALAKAAQSLRESCHKRMLTPESDHPCKPDDMTFMLYRSSI
ncbi:MAG: serine/threonine-protein phosphatase [Phycisphaerales bacterium]|nr:serine/threonine-protein phosphatase [Phycisphaerales bacterium]